MDHGSQRTVLVQKKPPRYRGPTWTDDEVHKLFHVWNQPDIYRGFLGQRKKQDVFYQMSDELMKLGVERSSLECQTKVKNLKNDFKRATEKGIPQTFKFYNVMENILLRPGTVKGDNYEEDCSVSGDDDSYTQESHGQDILVSANDTVDDQVEVAGHNHNQPVQIEFELMSSVDFQNMKGSQLPIEIEGGPHEFVTEVDTIVNDDSIHNEPHNSHQNHQHHQVRQIDDLVGVDRTPLIMITTTNGANFQPNPFVTDNVQQISTTSDSFVGLSTSKSYISQHGPAETGTNKRKLSAPEISQKRRKLSSISEKMAETVDRILTKTTNSLIDEIKASEERFMEWEEKRRVEEQKREEQMLRQLVDAIKAKPSDQRSNHSSTRSGINDEQDPNTHDMQRIQEMIRSSEDPCSVTFDLLATKLTTMLNDQNRETEESLMEWETKMQKQETRHTDNLFKILLGAVKTSRGSEC